MKTHLIGVEEKLVINNKILWSKIDFYNDFEGHAFKTSHTKEKKRLIYKRNFLFSSL